MRIGSSHVWLIDRHLLGEAFRWAIPRLAVYFLVAVAAPAILFAWAAFYTNVWPGIHEPRPSVAEPPIPTRPAQTPGQFEPAFQREFLSRDSVANYKRELQETVKVASEAELAIATFDLINAFDVQDLSKHRDEIHKQLVKLKNQSDRLLSDNTKMRDAATLSTVNLNPDEKLAFTRLISNSLKREIILQDKFDMESAILVYKQFIMIYIKTWMPTILL